MRIISRKDALSAGMRLYYTGVPCKRGHVSARFVSNMSCKECSAERGRSLETEAYQREYRDRNRLVQRDVRKAYRKANKDKIRARKRLYREKNLDKIKEKKSEYNRSNRHVIRAAHARRRARKAFATPAWLTATDRKVILSIYEMSSRLSECLGVLHHVDHIIPLNGVGVCGLHVPWNLAAIPAKINMSKHNKLLEDVQLI